MQFTSLSATYTNHTCRFDLDYNSRHASPSKSASRGLNKSYTQGRFAQPTQGNSKVHGWKTTNESTHSHDADHWSGPKDNTAPSSRQCVSATCSSGGAAGGSGQGPGGPKQEVAHLNMVISDDDEFADDPHQIISTEEVFTVPAFPRENLKGFDEGYLLPAEVTAFRGIYYQESGDVRPRYTGAFPFDYPLDHQGHVAL